MPAVLLTFLLISNLNVVKPTLAVPLQQVYGNDGMKQTENFKPAVPTDRFESLPVTTPIYVNEPLVTGGGRFHRQADSEAITSKASMTVTESSGPYESEQYTSHSTTEFASSKNTGIPLSTTEAYGFTETQEVTEGSHRETAATPTMSTDKYSELRQTAKNDTTGQKTPLLNSSRPYNQVESTSVLNGILNTESSTQSSNRTEDNKMTTPNELAVLNISTSKPSTSSVTKAKRHRDRIIILEPYKKEKYVWLKESVYSMLKDTMLKTETEQYVVQLNQRYEDLPIVDEDNSLWRKYSRAVVESFVLDFCRNYPYYTASEQLSAHPLDVEDYNSVYNSTLLHLKQKKRYTGVQFAAPVRRAADIYKAILDTPIGIVQSKCKAEMQQWLCFAQYLVRLADVADSCEHVWYHAHVHLTVLQSTRLFKNGSYPANVIVEELDSNLSEVETNNDVNYLFDFIVRTLGGLRNKLKDSLITQARLYSLIRQLQTEDKLKCLNIDEQTL